MKRETRSFFFTENNSCLEFSVAQIWKKKDVSLFQIFVLENEPGDEEEPGRKLVDGSPAHNMPKVEDAREKSCLNS